MKKILIPFDGHHFSEGAFEFARQLNERKRILLTGVFLPQLDYANLWSYSAGGMGGPLFIPLVENEDAVIVADNIKRFEILCKKNGIEYRVHKDFYDFALPELKRETRFADLVIIGSEKFYENAGIDALNEYLKDALHGVECPVVVVPEKFNFPKTNILTYDGSESSVYAIKQFAYLLPELAGQKTILVYVSKKDDEDIPNQSHIEELAARHFTDLTITRLHIDPKKYFSTWAAEKKNAIVVSGSFSKGGFNSILHKSFVSDIMEEHRIPVFITHH